MIFVERCLFLFLTRISLFVLGIGRVEDDDCVAVGDAHDAAREGVRLE